MATLFVIDLDRRICIARGSNVGVLAKFADRKSASSYTGNLNDVIGALKVDELTDLRNNALPPEGLPHTSIRTRVRHPIQKPHVLPASTLLHEPPPLMDQYDAALYLAPRRG